MLLLRRPRVTVPILEVPIRNLLPIEKDVWLSHLRSLGDPENFEPVEVVSHLASMRNGAPSAFILVDGAHRSYARAAKGYDTVRARAALCDAHVCYLGSSAVIGCSTIADVNDRYEHSYRHDVPPYVQTITDLPIDCLR